MEGVQPVGVRGEEGPPPRGSPGGPPPQEGKLEHPILGLRQHRRGEGSPGNLGPPGGSSGKESQLPQARDDSLGGGEILGRGAGPRALVPRTTGAALERTGALIAQ